MASKSSDWRPGPTVCRCCFADGCYKDISTEYFWMGKREVYSEMLSETFDLNIAYSQSGGPNSNSRLICEPCISRLRDASDFKRQVQECEKVFVHHLDSHGDETEAFEVPVEAEKEVKVEMARVKEESKLSDDDFDPSGFPDDDDDDLDDEPLTKLASKIPKKESGFLMDLLAAPKPEKRKSTSKTKAPPKKMKKKEGPKPSSSVSKPPAKTDKKKKEPVKTLSDRQRETRNAMLLVEFATAYPFRIPEYNMTCVYCFGDSSYDDPAKFREHMETEHKSFKVKIAFFHVGEAVIKVDCTDLSCRICNERVDGALNMAKHLSDKHKKPFDFNYSLGIQPFVVNLGDFKCCICEAQFPTMRHLSRHVQSHYLKFTCESCGKSYTTNSGLKVHIKYTHTEGKTCRRCHKTFASLAEMTAHVAETEKCWLYCCQICMQRFMKCSQKTEHMIKVHGASTKSFSCVTCSLDFPSCSRYYEHFKKYHK